MEKVITLKENDMLKICMENNSAAIIIITVKNDFLCVSEYQKNIEEN